MKQKNIRKMQRAIVNSHNIRQNEIERITNAHCKVFENQSNITLDKWFKLLEKKESSK